MFYRLPFKGAAKGIDYCVQMPFYFVGGPVYYRLIEDD